MYYVYIYVSQHHEATFFEETLRAPDAKKLVLYV